MRKHATKVAAWIVTAWTIGALPAAAETRWGLRASAWLEDSDPGVGVEWLVPMGARDWYFNPNVEVVFNDRDDRFIGNLDVHYDFWHDAGMTVWAGGGLAILHHDDPPRGTDSNEAGLNLLAGIGWRKPKALPYVQLKAVIADDSELVASIGVRF